MRSKCPCVSVIACSSKLFSRKKSSISFEASPGSMQIARRVSSQTTTRVFCWKGVKTNFSIIIFLQGNFKQNFCRIFRIWNCYGISFKFNVGAEIAEAFDFAVQFPDTDCLVFVGSPDISPVFSNQQPLKSRCLGEFLIQIDKEMVKFGNMNKNIILMSENQSVFHQFSFKENRCGFYFIPFIFWQRSITGNVEKRIRHFE